MRLSMDEVRKQHDGIKKLYEQGLRGATASVEQVLDLFDTIEALQAENEQLADETIKLMKENAKNSNKKDELVKALKRVKDILKEIHERTSCDCVQSGYNACLVMAMAHKGLVEIDKAIGGKEDV